MQVGIRDCEDGNVAARITAEKLCLVLPAVRNGDGQIGIALKDVRGGHHLVRGPGQAAGREATATVHANDASAGALYGAGQIIGEAGEDAA